MTERPVIGKVRFFSPEEFERRLKLVRRSMAEQGLDLLLVFIPENVLYLCGHQSIGYSSYLCLALPAEAEMTLLVREMETGCAQHYAWVEDVVFYADHENPVQVLCRALAERNLASGRVGVEMDAQFIGARRMAELTQALGPAAKAVDASGTVEQARRLKSADEIDLIRRACRTTEAGMRAGVEAVRAGATENDVAAAMFADTLKAGATYLSSQPIVTSGPRSGVAHTTFDGRVVQLGDMVLLELGGCVERYSGALMRCVAVGEVPPAARRMFDACLAGLQAALRTIAPGVPCGDPDAACVAEIARAGFETNYRKRTGYSVGVSYPPDWGEGHILSLRHGDPTPLEPGMVFHVVPALREYGRWAVGVSETVLVTPDGCEVLTNFPRRLFEAGRRAM
jgi:Xaa-Pro dipeptidase